MICVPVQASSLAQLKTKIKQVPVQAELIEIWIDRLPTSLEPKEILCLTKKKTLIVNKPKREKGSWNGTEPERVERLLEFAKAGATYIDIGIDTNPQLIKKIIKQSKQSKIIISYHNYTQTPSEKKLAQITQKAWKLRPDVVKIATFAKTTSDNFKLLQLLADNKKFIAVCMGPKGVISRIAGLALGNHINYIAADQNQKSAPGQLSFTQLQTLKDIIKFS